MTDSHEGPIHGLAWAHPSFGNILASCSFDSKVFIWKENDGGRGWSKIKEHTLHEASGTSCTSPSAVQPPADYWNQSTRSLGRLTNSDRSSPAPAPTAKFRSSLSTVSPIKHAPVQLLISSDVTNRRRHMGRFLVPRSLARRHFHLLGTSSRRRQRRRHRRRRRHRASQALRDWRLRRICARLDMEVSHILLPLSFNLAQRETSPGRRTSRGRLIRYSTCSKVTRTGYETSRGHRQSASVAPTSPQQVRTRPSTSGLRTRPVACGTGQRSSRRRRLVSLQTQNSATSSGASAGASAETSSPSQVVSLSMPLDC